MSVLTLILAGGYGARLSGLTELRGKPAVPFAGKYRMIDFVLSNVVNSYLSRVAVLAQFSPHSLLEHLGTGEPWGLNQRQPNGLQAILPGGQRLHGFRTHLIAGHLRELVKRQRQPDRRRNRGLSGRAPGYRQ